MRIVKLLGVLVFLSVLAGGAFVFKTWRELRHFRDTPFGSGTEKVVEIPAGTGPRGVVRLLTRAGVLADEEVGWRYLHWWKRDPRPLRAGEYAFTGPHVPDDVLERIYRGDVKTYRFTVPEGVRSDEIAAIVEKAGLTHADELLALVRDPELAKELGVPSPTLEGYLFPDTYAFPRSVKARAILGAMVDRFRDAWRRAEARRKPGVALEAPQAVVLASIIEKETGRGDERARISCVFHNRLRLGMKLQTDPTVMYATMLRQGGRWSNNISKKDLLTPHPYNTYLNAGLPPGPIANPGEPSLEAALSPADCRDLYFVSRNDGSHVFCPDLRCHSAAVQKWQVEFFRARRAARPAGAKAGAPPAPAPGG
ncbi:MAG TPA: endolytic transglycosylase MltG [Anaeromyxobacteraceae bacterium]|nr:endolytic transglycosylase MltG [Anaeromyxobacteraceae bacterium]